MLFPSAEAKKKSSWKKNELRKCKNSRENVRTYKNRRNKLRFASSTRNAQCSGRCVLFGFLVLTYVLKISSCSFWAITAFFSLDSTRFFLPFFSKNHYIQFRSMSDQEEPPRPLTAEERRQRRLAKILGNSESRINRILNNGADENGRRHAPAIEGGEGYKILPGKPLFPAQILRCFPNFTRKLQNFSTINL